ncbi:MAG: ADOP family duplicated permease [Terriglobales bacterium]
MWGWNWLNKLLQDIRYGLRRLRRAPGFSAAAILTLALGIGAATAIFSAVYAVLLRPLPFPNPSRLVAVESRTRLFSSGVTWTSDIDFLAWRRRGTAFSALAGYRSDSAALTGLGPAAREVNGAKISGGFFRTLGVRPMLGRGFTLEEHEKGGAPVVVISYALWRRLGVGRRPIGRIIRLDGFPRRIVGVMPPRFNFPGMEAALGGPQRDAYWIPYAFHTGQRALWRWLRVVGRLRTGATMAQAEAQLRAITIATERGRQNDFYSLPAPPLTVPLRAEVIGSSGDPLWLLLAASGLLLLIACANVANLLLARAANREREFAVCAALGAPRRRLAGQMIIESLALALGGGAIGLVLAWAALAGLKAAIPANVPRITHASLNPWVLAFAFAAAALTGLLAGLAPLSSLGHADLTEALKTGPREGGDRRGGRLRQGLVVAEIALALVLAVGSGLLFRSLLAINSVNPGYSVRNLVVLDPSPPSTYSPAQVRRYEDRMLASTRSQPGVASAAFAQVAPMTGSPFVASIPPPNRPNVPVSQQPVADENAVGPGFFPTMRIPILRGRAFTPADCAPKTATVAIIDTVMAREFWPGKNPVGMTFKRYTVIGVVPHIQIGSLATVYGPEFYIPASRFMGQYGYDIVARTSTSAAALAPQLFAAARAADPAVPVSLHTLSALISRTEAAPRFRAVLVGLFAALALALAAIGIYGVMAYAVERRRREIGVRAALGADRRRLLAMVVGEAMRLTLLGALAGSAAAWALTRAIRGMLFHTAPADPVSFAVALAVLAAAALAGALIPAARAARLDPADALRAE